MSKKKRNRRKEEQKLRCPVCHKSVEDNFDVRVLGLPGGRQLPPQAGDLTECHHCLTMLEYGADATSVTLRPAPQQRIDCFNKLTREGPRELSLPELVDYVTRYRRMPLRPPVGHRFRKCVTRQVSANT
jgi:hypothetical protein